MTDHTQTIAMVSGAIGAACNAQPEPILKITAGAVWFISNIALGSIAWKRSLYPIVALYGFYCCTSVWLIINNLGS